MYGTAVSTGNGETDDATELLDSSSRAEPIAGVAVPLSLAFGFWSLIVASLTFYIMIHFPEIRFMSFPESF